MTVTSQCSCWLVFAIPFFWISPPFINRISWFELGLDRVKGMTHWLGQKVNCGVIRGIVLQILKNFEAPRNCSLLGLDWGKGRIHNPWNSPRGPRLPGLRIRKQTIRLRFQSIFNNFVSEIFIENCGEIYQTIFRFVKASPWASSLVQTLVNDV